jgi:hypothetical protein
MLKDADIQSATHEERRHAVKTAIEASTDSERKDVAGAAVDALSPDERKDVIKEAVQSTPENEKTDVAQAAVDALSAEQRKELITSMWPSESHDRLYVYVAGFSAAVAVVLGLALIAWGAAGDDNGVSTALVVLATGFSSAILGGLLGAYVQK